MPLVKLHALDGKNAGLYPHHHHPKPKSNLDSEYFIMAVVTINTVIQFSQCYNKTLPSFHNDL